MGRGGGGKRRGEDKKQRVSTSEELFSGHSFFTALKVQHRHSRSPFLLRVPDVRPPVVSDRPWCPTARPTDRGVRPTVRGVKAIPCLPTISATCSELGTGTHSVMLTLRFAEAGASLGKRQLPSGPPASPG